MPEDAPTGGQMHRSQLSRSQREAMDRRNKMQANTAAMPPSGRSLREQRLAESAARKAAGVTLEVPPENMAALPPTPNVDPLDALRFERDRHLMVAQALDWAITHIEHPTESDSSVDIKEAVAEALRELKEQ